MHRYIYISNISLNKFYELLAVFLARLGEKRQQTAVRNTCLEFGAYFLAFPASLPQRIETEAFKGSRQAKNELHFAVVILPVVAFGSSFSRIFLPDCLCQSSASHG